MLACLVKGQMMTTIRELPATSVRTEQLEALQHFATGLGESQLKDLLLGLTTSIDEGRDVALYAMDDELTPNEVAALLKMSRTHLYKMLDRGILPSHRVGRDRRILYSDVVGFERQRQRDRRELAERFAHQEETRAGAIDELVNDL